MPMERERIFLQEQLTLSQYHHSNSPMDFPFSLLRTQPPFLHRLYCLFLSTQPYESAFVCTKWIGRFVCTVWGHRVTQTALHGCPDQVMTCHPNNFSITLRYPRMILYLSFTCRRNAESQTSYCPHTNMVKTFPFTGWFPINNCFLITVSYPALNPLKMSFPDIVECYFLSECHSVVSQMLYKSLSLLHLHTQ